MRILKLMIAFLPFTWIFAALPDTLMQAIDRDDSERVSELLLEQFATKPELDAALMRACMRGDRQIAALLLAAGANPNATGNDRRIDGSESLGTALNEAVKSRNPDLVRLLLAHGSQFQTDTHTFYSPLIVAAMNGDEKMFDVLQSSGADIEIKNMYGEGPLDFAIESGPVTLVSHLIRGLHNVDYKDDVLAGLSQIGGVAPRAESCRRPVRQALLVNRVVTDC